MLFKVHQKKGGYYKLVVLAVRPVGFGFLFGSPDLRSEILPCFTRDLYKLGRGTRWLGLITVERIAILQGMCHSLRTRSPDKDHYVTRDVHMEPPAGPLS